MSWHPHIVLTARVLPCKVFWRRNAFLFIGHQNNVDSQKMFLGKYVRIFSIKNCTFCLKIAFFCKILINESRNDAKKRSYYCFVQKVEGRHNFLSSQDIDVIFFVGPRFFIWDRENMGSQKFRPPKSSMGSYFQLESPKKRRFFEFGAVVGLWGGPHIQKFLATQFVGIVAEKQHLLFLLQKIDDFMNIWK